MNCRAWEDLLQQHLDGAGSDAALEQHLRACSECASQQGILRCFLAGISRLSPPAPPAELAGRVSAALLAEAHRTRLPRSRRLLPVYVLALAAGLFLALGLWWSRPAFGPPRPGGEAAARKVPEVAPENVPEKSAEPLQESVARAGNAAAALTSATAGSTFESAGQLLPLVRGSTLDSLTDPMGTMPDVPEPPLQPLLEAGEGVSTGLAPVAESARRAVNLFIRDLPMGRSSSENNPG